MGRICERTTFSAKFFCVVQQKFTGFQLRLKLFGASDVNGVLKGEIILLELNLKLNDNLKKQFWFQKCSLIAYSSSFIVSGLIQTFGQMIVSEKPFSFISARNINFEKSGFQHFPTNASLFLRNCF